MHSDSEMVKLRDVVETLIYMTDEDSDGVEEVMQLPTIDIVTCGECKHYAFGSCSKLHLIVSDDDFCSDGERSE